MELTAINVLGKNKRSCSKAAVAARKALKRPSGRPFKLSKPNEDSENSLGSNLSSRKMKRSLKNIKSRRKMSPLELLPTEILETIFLLCINIDLPKSSPIIAAKLSSSTIYNSTIIVAFGPTWEKRYGLQREASQSNERGIEHAQQSSRNSGDTKPVYPEQNPSLQSAILRCRWATLPVILNAKETWVEKHAKDCPLIPKWFIPQKAPPRNSLLPHVSQPPQNCGQGGIADERDAADQDPPDVTAQEYFETDFQAFSNFILGHRDGGSLWEDCSWGNQNDDVANGLEIPHSLLSGPWTEDSIRYLFWVIKSGAFVDWYTQTTGEIGFEGVKKAIQTGDVRAIHLLAWAGIVEKLEVKVLTWAFRNAGGDKLATINQVLRLNFDQIQDRELRKIDEALAEMMEEAKQDGDEEKLELVMNIALSKTLKGKLVTVEIP